METYSFDQGFAGGMRIDLSPDKIPINASPSMQDVNYSNGAVPTKRFGFAKISETVLDQSPIRLMTEFKTGGTTEFLVVCGGKIYKEI